MLNQMCHIIRGMKDLEKLATLLIIVAKRMAEVSDMTAPEVLRAAADELDPEMP